MALVSCPECGHRVSNQAHSCPSCGYPIAKKTFGEFNKRAHSPDPMVRLEVAANKATPPEILDYLSYDFVPEVVKLVARNPSTPIETLELISDSLDMEARSLARHNLRNRGR